MILYKWRREFGEHGTVAFQGYGIKRLSDEERRVKELEQKLENTELEPKRLKKRLPSFQK